jgi:hypothetical protein
MATPAEKYQAPKLPRVQLPAKYDWRANAPVGTLDFETEAEAQAFCVETLRPFCSSLMEQPEFRQHGIRPDVGFRLAELPNIALLLEVKKFAAHNGFGSTMCEAISQAADYAQRLKRKVFIGPLSGWQATQLSWAMSPAGAMCLLAAQFNVGAALIGDNPYEKRRVVLLMIADQVIARLTFGPAGNPITALHSNAAHLLAYKERRGSSSWR